MRLRLKLLDMTLKSNLIAGLAAALIAAGCAKQAAPVPDVDPMSAEGAASVSATVASLASASDSAGIARFLEKACGAAAVPSQCYESQLVPLARDGKVKVAMGALGQIAAVDPAVRNDGHVYAHAIGIAAGQSTENVAQAFMQCSEAFQSGCYHGTIQAWFARLDSIGAPEANALCEPFRADDSQRWLRFQCVHGMGHGLTTLNRHDLKAGLAGCDLLTDSWDRHACYGGAFMENIVNVTNPHHPASALASASDSEHAGHDMSGEASGHEKKFKAADPDDPQYPCSILADRYLRPCYEMQTSVMLHNNGGDIAGAARGCDAAPVKLRPVCYSSLGRDISSYSQQNHSEAIRMCSSGSKLYQPWCYFGVVKNLVDLNARASDGLAFCRAVTAEANKQVCYNAVGEQILVLAATDAERAKLCAPTESSYLDTCLYGARIEPVAPPRLVRVLRSIE